jgi:hypothetical protein
VSALPGAKVKKFFWLSILAGVATISDHSSAAEISKDQVATLWQSSCNPWVDYNCEAPKISPKALMERRGNCDPYLDYKCLDPYLGTDFFTRFYRYYALEWGHASAPSDPNAPPGRRSDSVWPPTPQSTPPMPFTEWPYGGTPAIGVTRPNSVDSPLMVALSNTQLGAGMNASHVQVYGWVAAGGNLSTNSVKPAGNAPVGYDYTPNTVQLDQAVVYIERLPDTVQNDHFDWVSAYREYTASIIATRLRTACSATNFSTTISSMATTFRWSMWTSIFL